MKQDRLRDMAARHPLPRPRDAAPTAGLHAVETLGTAFDNRTPGGARRRGWLVRRMLVGADVLGLGLAFAVAVLLFRNAVGPTDPVGPDLEVPLFVATLPGWVLLARLHGLYSRDEERASHTTIDDVVGVFHLVTVGTFLFFASAWLTGLAEPYPPKLITFWALAIVLVTAGRVAARAASRSSPAYLQNTVIVGADEIGVLVAGKILDHPEYGVRLVGFIDGSEVAGRELVRGLPIVGAPADLTAVVREHDIERVIVGYFESPVEEAIELVRSARDLGVQVDVVPRLFGAVGPRAQLHTLEGFPLIGLPPVRLSRSALAAKRAGDVVLSAVGLVLLAPIFLAIAIRIKIETPGPVFFRHERVGRAGVRFDLVKFRTMHAERPSGGAGEAALERLLEDPSVREEFARTHKLEHDPRVTRFGRLLRRTSLDELPQLLNVLLGHMSLVGPRPVTEAELLRYEGEVNKLLTFRPGITGYWQVNGRSRTTYEERVRLDLAYVRGWSLKLDLTILGKTFLALVRGHGAY